MRLLSNRPVQILLLILLLAAVVLAGTPPLIKHFAIRWLQENGGEQVRFQDVDLNPFTGRLALKGLDVRVNDRTTLSFKTATADLAWLPLWHRQVKIQGVTLDGLDIVIRQLPDRTLVGGLRLPAGDSESPAAPPAENPWTAGIDTLALNDIRVRYVDEKLDLVLVLDHLQLSRLAQWSADTPTPVEAAGKLNDASFTLDGEIMPLAATPRYDLRLRLDALQLAAFDKLLRDQVDKLSAKLSYDGTLAFEQHTDGFRVSQSGKLRLQALDTVLRQPPITLRNDDAQVRSELSLATVGGTQDLALKSDIRLSGLDLNAEEGRLQLLHSDGLQVTGLDMSAADRLSLQSVTADSLAFARRVETEQQEAGKYDIGKLQLDKLTLADNLLAIDSLNLNGVHRRLHRDRDGNWATTSIIGEIQRLAAPPEAAPKDGGGDAPTAADGGPAAEAAAPASPPMAFAIRHASVDGDNVLSLLDESVDPPLEAQVSVSKVVMESLDTRHPEQPSPVQIEAGIDDRTELTLQGTFKPFMEPPALDIKSKISALDLPPLSPYAQAAMGLELDSGTLDADIDIKTDSQAIDGLVKLRLYQLQLKTVKSENSLQSQLPVPINVALDTLRDSNNTIALKIPIKGDPANPDFNVNDALTKALAGSVQKGALTYLTLALQPYGAMIAAAKYAGEAVTKVRLNPVEFAAGHSELPDGAGDYLSKVAKVLKDRPQLAIKVCGVAVARDRTSLQEQAAAAQKKTADTAKPAKGGTDAGAPAVSDTRLRALAQARAQAVRGYLVEHFSTPASRLVACQPRIETGDPAESVPRTDLLL